MKKLKIILLYSFYILVICYTIIIVKNNIYTSKYKDETTLKGIINDYELTKEYLRLELIGKEKILCTYYFNNDYDILKKKIKLGIVLELKGELIKPKKNTNFNLFNYRNYLLSKNIY